MKICSKCRSRTFSGEVRAKYIVLSGQMSLPDDKMVAVQRQLYGDDDQPLKLRNSRLIISEEFDPGNLEHYKSVTCSNCGGTEFEDSSTCPNCGAKDPDLVACHYNGAVICTSCRDRWSCQECAHKQCKLNPRYEGQEEPEFPKKVQADWLNKLRPDLEEEPANVVGVEELEDFDPDAMPPDDMYYPDNRIEF